MEHLLYLPKYKAVRIFSFAKYQHYGINLLIRKDKDELYLVCVTECFDKLTTFLNSKRITFNNVEEDIKKYLDIRHQFFIENPHFSNIFTSALLQPPKHLIEQIKEIKAELDKHNVNYYEQILQNVNLKGDVCREEAIEYFLIFQESLNNYFQSKTYEGEFGKMMD